MSLYSTFSPTSSVVQKYGGTSMGSTEKILKIASRIGRLRRQGVTQIAVVVSAMSGETNRLVELIGSVNQTTSKKHYDTVVAAGEQISIGLLAAALEKHGVKSETFLAHQIGIQTEGSHGKARIRSIETEKIRKCWQNSTIPVIAGFQGTSKEGRVTTLGRGGSDTSAVAIAAALRAAFCEINTDVSGMYTTDPRIVPEAKLIEQLDYETSLELAALGSKVLHSRCVEIAAKYNLPLVVRSTFDDENARSSLIMSLNSNQNLEAPLVSGITLDRDVVKVTVSGVPIDGHVFSQIFSKIAEASVNVDIIVANRLPEEPNNRFGFTIDSASRAACERVLGQLKKLEGFEDLCFRIEHDLQKVSIVGLGMKSNPGVASRTFKTLQEKGVEVLMISTSEIKISCVVSEQQGEQAVRILHECFFQA